jgi:hypothetical protein
MEELDVIFLDDDRKTVLSVIKVEYGDSAVYPGPTPTKEPVAGVKYTFIGWEGQEKLSVVTEKTIVYAKYETEASVLSNGDALYNASLKNAEATNYNVVVEAGQKAVAQEQAIEKDSRTAEQIVSDIMENGKTEVGQEMNKDFEK